MGGIDDRRPGMVQVVVEQLGSRILGGQRKWRKLWIMSLRMDVVNLIKNMTRVRSGMCSSRVCGELVANAPSLTCRRRRRPSRRPSSSRISEKCSIGCRSTTMRPKRASSASVYPRLIFRPSSSRRRSHAVVITTAIDHLAWTRLIIQYLLSPQLIGGIQSPHIHQVYVISSHCTRDYFLTLTAHAIQMACRFDRYHVFSKSFRLTCAGPVQLDQNTSVSISIRL